LYANIDNFSFSEDLVPYEDRPEIDRWIISKLNSTVKEYESLMENYDVTKAARLISSFTIDQLSNWYVRRSRRRFWKSEINKNKISAYQTLYECLLTVAKLASPFAPFIAEELYRNLNGASKLENFESVHLVEFPKVKYIDAELEIKMEIAQKVVYLSRSIRAKNNLKVRQPLQKIMIAVDSSKKNAVEEMQDVILEEVNIKEMVVLDDDSGIVNKSAKANFKVLGPKYGKMMKQLAAAISALTNDEINKLELDGELKINAAGEIVDITPEDIIIQTSEIEGWVVESEEGVTVAIDTELNESLIAEGYSREFVNRIQNMRKDSGLDVMDRIKILFSSDNKAINYITAFSDYISKETLADKIVTEKPGNGFIQNWEIGEFNFEIGIIKSN
jgi:isoleucyl-tRNA synthetase